MLIRNVLFLLLPFYVCCLEKWNFFRKDYDLNKNIGYWFKLNPMPAKWHDARKKCEIEGAVLASPFNSQILSALQSIVKESQLDAVFTGLHSTFSDNDWQSIEGTPLQDMKLNKIICFSQDAVEKCAVIEFKHIVTVNCTDKFPFICYKNASEVAVAVASTKCGTSDAEYEFDSRTGSCYKVHPELVTWPKGFEVCRAEGGYLAVIDNNTELQVITELFEKKAQIMPSIGPQANIGLIDWEQNRNWYTIHGKALDQEGKAMWGNGEPNNNGGNEYCASVSRNNRLNDLPCSHPVAFICEKDV